jgi:hypothetical protein
MRRKLKKADLGQVMSDVARKASNAAKVVDQHTLKFSDVAFPGILAMNLGLDALTARKAETENQAYEAYWRNEYQTPSLVTNPNAFGNTQSMKKGGKVKTKKYPLGGIADVSNKVLNALNSYTTRSNMLGVPEALTTEADRTIGGPHLISPLGAKYMAQEAERTRVAAQFMRQFPDPVDRENYRQQLIAQYGSIDPKTGDFVPNENYYKPKRIPKGGYEAQMSSGAKALAADFRAKFKKGGEARKNVQSVDREIATIEAEKGEKILGQGLYNIGGQPHSAGGTPILANPGEFIFSDDISLSLPKDLVKDFTGKSIKRAKDRTPSAIAGRYMKLNDNILKTQDSDASELDKKTSLYNVQNIMRKLGYLADLQEGMKGFPDGRAQIARLGGFVDSTLPVYRIAGKVKTGDVDPKSKEDKRPIRKTQKAKGLTQAFNKFSADWLPSFGYENTPQGADAAIKNLGYTGDINNNKEVQKFLVRQLADQYNQYGFKQGQTIFDNLLSEYLPTTQGINSGMSDSVTNYSFGESIGDDDIAYLDKNFSDNIFGKRSGAMLQELMKLNKQNLGRISVISKPDPENEMPYTYTGPQSTPSPAAPASPAASKEEDSLNFTTRDYANKVLPNAAEIYGVYAANKRYKPRYPTAQKFYEGDNIDAILNSNYTPLTAQAELNAIQRSKNAAIQNMPLTPMGMAYNVGVEASSQVNSANAAGAVERLNIQRKDQLATQLAQNQLVKGQQRLQLQDKYIKELETVKNNMEVSDKLRMSQTANILNSYTNRKYGTRYMNAMADNFQIDPFGNIKALPIDIAKAAKSTRASMAGSSPLSMLVEITNMIQKGQIDPGSIDMLRLMRSLQQGPSGQ